MRTQPLVRRARWASPLVLLLVLALAPTAGAQDSGTVSVTATVGSAEVTLAICDTTATFGGNLSATGDTPTNTGGDTILVTTASAAGSYYVWTPSCLAGTPFLQVTANDVSWTGSACATSNTGTSSLVSGGTASDLRFGTVGPFYEEIDVHSFIFPSCGPLLGNNWITGFGSGVHAFNYYYYLRVENSDMPGTFQADTIWTVNML